MGKYHFQMNTNGYCLFCLRPPGPPTPPTQLKLDVQHVPSVFSFRNICKYLSVDLKEVFSDAIPISAKSLSVLEHTELKGTLCEECALVWERFSRYFLEMKVIQMKLKSSLDSLSELMRTANEDTDGRDVNQFKMEMIRHPDTSLQLGIVERLRTKTLEQCSHRLNQVSPQVKLQKISLEVPTQNIKSESKDFIVSEDFQDSPSEIVDVKFEPCLTSPSSPCLLAQVPAVAAKVKDGKPKPSINPETRRHKCNLCGKEFVTVNNYYSHYDNEHFLGTRYQCQLCAWTFTLESSLKVHYQNVHVGQRFKCQFCPKSFTSRSSRATHVRQSCKVRKRQCNTSPSISTKPESAPSSSSLDRQPSGGPLYCEVIDVERTTAPEIEVGARKPPNPISTKTGKSKCPDCGKEFTKPWSYHCHYRSAHMGVRYKCQICNKMFTLKNNLLDHQKCAHFGQRLQCQFCSKWFAGQSRQTWKTHVKYCQVNK